MRGKGSHGQPIETIPDTFKVGFKPTSLEKMTLKMSLVSNGPIRKTPSS